MKTLKQQLEERSIIIGKYFERLGSQECEILAEATANDGSTLIQINCFQTEKKHPAEIIGKAVIVIEDGELVEVDKNAYSSFFNN